MVNNWLVSIQRFLFPGSCMICRRDTTSGRDLCHHCATQLPCNSRACRRCALPLPAGSKAGALCGGCQTHTRPYDRVIAPWLYDGEIRHLHLAFKFERRLAAGRLLADLLCDTIEERQLQLPELLVPVPLHPSRVRERGFNQATELARILSRRLDIPVDQFCIRRRKATAPQSGLNKSARRDNIRGAFALQGELEASHVAIVDDVMTTGMTIEQVAKVLRRGGIGRIDVWVIARRG